MTAEAGTADARGGLGEFGRISRFFSRLSADAPGAFGLTDDAAVLDLPADQELVVTTDAMVEQVHFLGTDPPADIAAKLLRVNLSDLAAMAARPLAYTLTTVLPARVDDSWLEAFAEGLAADQRQYGLPLVGGDSVSTPGPMVFSVTAFGQVARGRAVRRASPPEASVVFVTGSIGDAALALRTVLGDLALPDSAAQAALLQRLRRPEPRLAFAAHLSAFGGGAIDVSDGLVADLGHLCAASGCAARLNASGVPLSAAARALVQADPTLLEVVLTGGDDYELVFTAPPGLRGAVAEAAAASGTPVTEIGSLVPGSPGAVTVLAADGSAMPLERRGWTHM